MRFPIRNQILLPLTAIQVVVISAVSLWAAWKASTHVRDDAENHARNVRGLLERATFPLTGPVLEQVRQLSGAEYALFDRRSALAYATLDGGTGRNSELHLAANRARDLAGAEVEIAGRTYRAVWVQAGGAAGPPMEVLMLLPRDQLQALQRDAIAGPLLAGGLILVLTVLATTWVAQRMGRRIQRLERQAARIAEGDFTPLDLLRRDDEFRDLSCSINRMAGGLESLTGSIRETERGRLATQVVGGIAHQLRNAMTGIRMAIQVHQRRCKSTGDASLDVALGQLSLTEQQIRGLLSLTRGEQRSILPGRAADLLNEIAAMLEPVCEHRRIVFRYESECDSAAVVTDADAFRSAILNLCMNGVEAAGHPGELSLAARLTADAIEVAVADNGSGVPERVQQTLFAPFVTTKPEGVGLGLALVRRAADDLGGSVGLARSEGRTVFTFRCAVQPAAPDRKMLAT
ncbi:MAG: HAMP domain-containing sensor histidine kinase [Planctomycetaceae bacterium]